LKDFYKKFNKGFNDNFNFLVDKFEKYDVKLFYSYYVELFKKVYYFNTNLTVDNSDLDYFTLIDENSLDDSFDYIFNNYIKVLVSPLINLIKK
jgi:hypothetical protein